MFSIFHKVFMFLAFVAGVSFATSAWNSSALTTQETFSDTTKRTMFFQIGTDFNFGFNGGPTDPTLRLILLIGLV